jgi:hypothetical protein
MSPKMNQATVAHTRSDKVFTDRKIVAAGERIARRLAKHDGFEYTSETPMWKSPGARAQSYWRKATVVLDALNGTDLAVALQNIEEAEEC